MESAGKSITLLFVVLLSTSSVAVPVAMLADATSTWNFQSVGKDEWSARNSYCPIAVDSNSTPHILYTGPGLADTREDTYAILRYATWNGSSWNTQDIPYAVGYDLAFDANNNTHILYEHMSAGKQGLMYARWTGSYWASQIIDAQGTGWQGYGTLALDSYGNPHAAYVIGNIVKYASWTGSQWRIQIVDQSSSVWLSLAIDSNNIPYILYSSEDNSETKLATWKDSRWSTDVFPNSSGSGNVVLDSKGNPHFVYAQKKLNTADSRNRTIVIADKNGDSWNYNTVASNISMAFNKFRSIFSLKLDSHDYPHLAYLISPPYNYDMGSLVYTSWTGTDWESQTFDTGVNARKICYLALDSSGNPHISYLSNGGEYIMYTTPVIPSGIEPSETPNMNTIIIALGVAVAAVVAVGVLVYFKKRKYQF